jgi:prepilin-type N-terminal cleavage/methylation domain-containing protein
LLQQGSGDPLLPHNKTHMKTTQTPALRGFTLIELLVVISIIAIIAALAMPAFAAFIKRGRMTQQLNDGKQIYYALRSYASETSHGGAFPAYKDIDDSNTRVTTSNEAFEVLVPRYLDNKQVFINRNSPWCQNGPKTGATVHRVLPGESDWCYVRGLRDSSNSQWPILANAFAPGSTTYIQDASKPGGVWKGTDAVVIWAGGSGELVETKAQGETYFIKRPDKPSANAFAKDEDWLAGENVEILYPQSN